MSEGTSRFGWIYRLSADRVRGELTRRGQSTEGTLPTLHDRLLRCELDSPLGPDPSRPPSRKSTASGRLRPPTPPEMRPDSPGSFAFEDVAMREDVNAAHTDVRAPVTRSSATEIYNALRKWNLTFSGARGGDAEAFLIRIEEGRALFPVSDADLFRCLPFFLSGTALYWYRNRRSEWRTWDEFRTAWRTRFSDPDFQFALRDEILRRTQGEQESVADYLTCMQALFDRLSPPWSIEEQLNYAHRNMLPKLQVAVRRYEFRDFASLELLVSRIEASHDAATRYRAPPAPERSLFPELAYRPKSKPARAPMVAAAPAASTGQASANRSRARANPAVAGPSTATIGAAPASSETAPARVPTTARCWNCDKIGHLARECGEARRMYCYRCGKTGVTVNTCPTCSGNAEGGR